MRSIRLVLAVVLTTLLTTPAWSQAVFSPPDGWSPPSISWSPEPPYTFVQGRSEPYTLYFRLSEPGMPNFQAGDVFISYLDSIFTPIALLTSVTPAVLSVDSGITGGTVKQAHITLGQAQDPIPQDYTANVPAGSLFGIQFMVKSDAPLGPTEVAVDYTFAFTNYSVALVEQMQLLGTELPWNEWEHSDTLSFSATIAAVPEASTWAMMLVGLGLVGACAMRARRRT